MRINIRDIPDEIFTKYNLMPLVHNWFVMVEIRKGMYGLPQTGILANNRLQKTLARTWLSCSPSYPKVIQTYHTAYFVYTRCR